MENIIDKMALIQSIFIDSKEKALSISGLEELNKSLLKNDTEFISIAFEAASMGIAINSIEKSNSLSNWIDFYQNYGEIHAAQVHVGLGWALSELNIEVSLYLNDLDPFYKYRVVDGYGYYDGKFKRRESVRLQQIPKDLDNFGIRAYNQGLGRSFWYTAQGEVEKLTRLITIFPEERHYDMWRGVGIAVAYVGGVKQLVLQDVIQNSNKNLNAFKCGIALASQTRIVSKAISEDTEKICQFVTGLTTEEVYEKLLQLEKEACQSSSSIYFDWIKNIEATL